LVGLFNKGNQLGIPLGNIPEIGIKLGPELGIVLGIMVVFELRPFLLWLGLEDSIVWCGLILISGELK